jgi:putative membrane protein
LTAAPGETLTKESLPEGQPAAATFARAGVEGAWRRVTLFAVAAVYAVLWVGGVSHHFLYGGVGPGLEWVAALFLTLAGALVLLGARSWRARRSLVGVALLGFGVEALGVHTGLPFGAYRYTGALGPGLFGVPLVMTAAWMTLAAYAAQLLLRGRRAGRVEVLLAALWVTAIDLIIDPLAANQLGYWRWAAGGDYYGIPPLNFAGWFATALLAFALFGRPTEPNPWARRAGFSILLFFTLLAFAHALHLAALIGCALCLLHFVLTRNAER